MPKKNKADTSKRSGRMSTDPVTVQVSVKVLKRPKGAQPTATLLQEVVDQWARTGRQPKGFEVTVVKWRNPARKGAKGNWRIAHSEDQRQCKLIRRMLRGTSSRLEFS